MFCINNGSCISILCWVLHTLNRPHCLERVLPDILVNGVTVAKLKECEHKPIEKKHCQRHNGPKALIALTHSTPLVQKEASTSFEILVKLQLCFVGQRARYHVITNPFSNFTNPHNKLEKSRYQFLQIHVTTSKQEDKFLHQF